MAAAVSQKPTILLSDVEGKASPEPEDRATQYEAPFFVRAVQPAVRPFSLVLPAWNDETRLRSNLGPLVDELYAANSLNELIVVADGSTDGTTQAAREFTERGVVVLSPSARLGKGRAVLLGAKAAQTEVLAFMDVDCPVPLSTLVEMVRQTESADCIIASRYLPRSEILGHQSLVRAIASRCWRQLVRLILGLRVSDTQCGVKVFRRDALLRVSHAVAISGWAFDASLLYHMHERGYRIREVPVAWRNNGVSKLRLLRVVPVMLLSLIAIRLANSHIRPLLPWKTLSRAAALIELGRPTSPA